MRDRSRPSASEQDSGGPAYDLGGCGASAFGRNRDGMELGATLRTGWYAFKVQRDGPLLSQVSTVNITIGVGMLNLATTWGFPEGLTWSTNARVPGQPAEG